MPDLPALVQALLKPEAYPERPATVELVQTHISFVFLTGQHVYKVKKPVDFGFLDFTTLEKRLHYCNQEVLLNRRLAPDVYLGVVEIRKTPSGEIAIEGPGEVVEYAVKMRQLPRERAMNVLLDQGQVTKEQVRELAQVMARFHAQAESTPAITQYGSAEAVGRNALENFEQTEQFAGQVIPRRQSEETRDFIQRILRTERPLLEQRQREGKIRDCHGDLHSGQIVLAEKLYILDCIEFNERFRYIDVMNDIAFLAMDLDFHGRRDLTKALMDAYLAASQDSQGLALMDFYKSYRAAARGKVACLQLKDPAVSDTEKARLRRLAADYFDLAHAYARSGKAPLLLICAGMVGTGKSTVAQDVAQRAGLEMLSSDIVRKTLAGIPLTERRLERFGSGLYSPEFTRKTYDELYRRARELLRAGRSVVLDASFQRSQERDLARSLAEEVGAQWYVLECTCAEDEVKTRLEERMRRGTSPSDARWEIYVAQKQTFEPFSDIPRFRHVVVDTTASSRQAAAQVVEYLEEVLKARG